MAFALFIKDEDLKRHTILDGNIDSDKFKPYVKLAQDIHIHNYLGTDLYRRLQEGVIAGNLNSNETKLINDFIQDALIHFAAAEYLPFAAYSILNGGAFKNQPDNRVIMEKVEVDALVNKEKSYAEYYATRLVDFLCENSTLYPEFRTNTDDDIRPDRFVNYSGGIYINTTDQLLDLLKFRNLEL